MEQKGLDTPDLNAVRIRNGTDPVDSESSFPAVREGLGSAWHPVAAVAAAAVAAASGCPGTSGLMQRRLSLWSSGRSGW